jgi:hypothetical protein
MRGMTKLALLALQAAACSNIKVSTNEMPGAAQTAAAYRTYAWLPTKARDESHNNPFVEGQLKQAVERDLTAKGYRKVARNDNPDFLIGWHVTTQEKTQVEAINPYWGYGWGPAFGPPGAYGGAWGPGGTYVTEYEQGTLILDVVDAKSNALVWRGTAKANLGANPTGEDAQKKINQATDKILAKFPPTS